MAPKNSVEPSDASESQDLIANPSKNELYDPQPKDLAPTSGRRDLSDYEAGPYDPPPKRFRPPPMNPQNPFWALRIHPDNKLVLGPHSTADEIRRIHVQAVRNRSLRKRALWTLGAFGGMMLYQVYQMEQYNKHKLKLEREELECEEALKERLHY